MLALQLAHRFIARGLKGLVADAAATVPVLHRDLGLFLRLPDLRVHNVAQNGVSLDVEELAPWLVVGSIDHGVLGYCFNLNLLKNISRRDTRQSMRHYALFVGRLRPSGLLAIERLQSAHIRDRVVF